MSTGSKLGKIVLGAAEVTGLKEASRRIFGNLPQLNIGKTGNKILRKALIADKVVTYYPATINKIAHKEWYGYKTDLDIWRENRLSRMYMRGNPPTKKGEGKRAQQAKKKK
ncbi:mitochondral 37s ribosomal protein s27-like [Nannochloropsis oceanica]|eukprot:evm.model.NODE_9677_length_9592_cov_31.903254.2